MKCSILPLALAAFYAFTRLVVNGTLSSEFQYIRDVRGNAGDDNLWQKSFPLYGPEDPRQACNRQSFPVLNKNIQTAIYDAGTSGAFYISTKVDPSDVEDPYIFHEGPGQVFLSKLPDGLNSLSEYDGSGDFFKIAYHGPKNSTTWSLYEERAINFTIPRTTPPGLYLMRVEHFLPSALFNQSQWFVSCAHVEILGLGGGQPTGFVRFPNAYKADDPSVWFHEEGTSRFPKDIRVYVEPKPSTWTG
ncbi:fungal cellulose binding domain-containing protein [Dendryphion nanum]|uniref:lytic cellulose monooxygenase (C4-dehydrogenating) n=1 Tax=Dendryphion nanum TaxID=256645 RepID=A0A9P9E0P5_9PLEO|nr:fungal cellulose binding domain-containing protein [Dendryphion nanum]